MRNAIFILSFSLLYPNSSLFAQNGNESICIGERFTIQSKILNQEREIFIKIPKGYDTSNTAYPVHIILDAEITFHSYSSLVEIMFEGEEYTNPLIVGIPNVDRNFDFNPEENGYKFLDFITKELISHIDNKYRTDGNRLLCGYSMGGTYVIFALLNATDTFSSFLAGSPYRLDIFSESDIEGLGTKLKKNKTLYTSMGQDDRVDQMEFFLKFCKTLNRTSMDNLRFKYEVIPKRDHDNSFIINWMDGLSYITDE